ncbi:hypothetical protein MNV49_007428 [Pseudohyphozyma bogoriensis]|nr:hypothetical protein MNV49_007428 [Pseudohyphozyma bogoriensis]
MSQFTLHEVTVENAEHTIPDVHRLVVELAIFEKEPDAVDATPALFRKNLLEEKLARCVLVYDGPGPMEGGKAIGMALYFFNFSTWTGKGGLYLEDLFVSDAYRGQGIAKLLFKYLANICKEKDLARMEWVVLKWNEGAKKVYEKLGASVRDEWDLMRLTGEPLAKLAE